MTVKIYEKEEKLLHKCFFINKVLDLQDWLLLHRLTVEP